MAKLEQCDFCCVADGVFRYGCAEFKTPEGWFNGGPAPGDSDWAACDPCATMVEVRDVDGLVEAATRRSPRVRPPVNVVRMRILGFFAHYNGQRIRIKDGKCDFCNRIPQWEYPAKNFHMPNPTGQVYQSDGAWASCDGCAALIETNNYPALVQRYLKARPPVVGAVMHPWVAALFREFKANRIGPRRPILVVADPDIPNVGAYSVALQTQLGLRDWWRTDRAMEMMSKARGEDGQRTFSVRDLFELGRSQAASLDQAETYYIAPGIAQFLNESSASVPDTAAFRPEDLPTGIGFAYLAEPLETACTFPEGHMERGDPVERMTAGGRMSHSPAFHRVRAVAWYYEPESVADLVLNIYVDSHAGDVVFRDQFTWPVMGTVVDPLAMLAGAGAERMLTEPARNVRVLIDPVRRLLITTWTFISQRIADQAARRANGQTRKRLRTSKEPTDQYRQIRIIYLREADRKVTNITDVRAIRDRTYRCRWYRRPHQRNVRIGPGRTERRMVWIKGQICGPRTPDRDSLPLRASRAIYVVNQ